jgi:hypothetical protein
MGIGGGEEVGVIGGEVGVEVEIDMLMIEEDDDAFLLSMQNKQGANFAHIILLGYYLQTLLCVCYYEN